MKDSINVFPLSTEKAYRQAQSNIYIFKTPLKANRQQIKAAIEERFNVTVINLKTLVQFGKKVRAQKGKHNRPATASRQDFKKAYATLKAGDSIKVFDEAVKDEEVKKPLVKEKK